MVAKNEANMNNNVMKNQKYSCLQQCVVTRYLFSIRGRDIQEQVCGLKFPSYTCQPFILLFLIFNNQINLFAKFNRGIVVGDL